MKCKGGCDNEGIYNGWCVETFNKCSGYKKRLSEKAKLRGNNKSRGLLSKKYVSDDFISKMYNFICIDCKNPFQRHLKLYHTKQIKHGKQWEPVCDDCCVIRKLNTENEKKKQEEFILISNNQYEKINYLRLKEIVFSEQGNKCHHCNYDKFSIKNGPYELHHKDGNNKNNKRENIEVLCRNCHAMTPNFVFRGKTHTEETKIKIRLAIRKSQKVQNCLVV